MGGLFVSRQYAHRLVVSIKLSDTRRQGDWLAQNGMAAPLFRKRLPNLFFSGRRTLVVHSRERLDYMHIVAYLAFVYLVIGARRQRVWTCAS